MTDKIKVIADGLGRGRVWFNDREISSLVVGVRANVRAGKPVRVTLDVYVDELEFHAAAVEVKTTHPPEDE